MQHQFSLSQPFYFGEPQRLPLYNTISRYPDECSIPYVNHHQPFPFFLQQQQPEILQHNPTLLSRRRGRPVVVSKHPPSRRSSSLCPSGDPPCLLKQQHHLYSENRPSFPCFPSYGNSSTPKYVSCGNAMPQSHLLPSIHSHSIELPKPILPMHLQHRYYKPASVEPPSTFFYIANQVPRPSPLLEPIKLQEPIQPSRPTPKLSREAAGTTSAVSTTASIGSVGEQSSSFSDVTTFEKPRLVKIIPFQCSPRSPTLPPRLYRKSEQSVWVPYQQNLRQKSQLDAQDAREHQMPCQILLAAPNTNEFPQLVPGSNEYTHEILPRAVEPREEALPRVSRKVSLTLKKRRDGLFEGHGVREISVDACRTTGCDNPVELKHEDIEQTNEFNDLNQNVSRNKICSDSYRILHEALQSIHNIETDKQKQNMEYSNLATTTSHTLGEQTIISSKNTSELQRETSFNIEAPSTRAHSIEDTSSTSDMTTNQPRKTNVFLSVSNTSDRSETKQEILTRIPRFNAESKRRCQTTRNIVSCSKPFFHHESNPGNCTYRDPHDWRAREKSSLKLIPPDVLLSEPKSLGNGKVSFQEQDRLINTGTNKLHQQSKLDEEGGGNARSTDANRADIKDTGKSEKENLFDRPVKLIEAIPLTRPTLPKLHLECIEPSHKFGDLIKTACPILCPMHSNLSDEIETTEDSLGSEGAEIEEITSVHVSNMEQQCCFKEVGFCEHPKELLANTKSEKRKDSSAKLTKSQHQTKLTFDAIKYCTGLNFDFEKLRNGLLGRLWSNGSMSERYTRKHRGDCIEIREPFIKRKNCVESQWQLLQENEKTKIKKKNEKDVDTVNEASSDCDHIKRETTKDRNLSVMKQNNKNSQELKCISKWLTRTHRLPPSFILGSDEVGFPSIIINNVRNKIEQHVQLEKINSGTFCTVYKGYCRGQFVAIKCPLKHHLIDDPDMMSIRAVKELRLLYRSLDHNNILKLCGGVIVSKSEIWIVTEYIGGGDLYKKLYQEPRFQLTPSQRLKIMIQLASALSFLHGLEPKIVHKDLKTNNILVDDNCDIRLCDFGDAEEIKAGEGLKWYTAVTWQYASPEIILSRDPSRPERHVNESVDIWSLGCIYLELCYKPTPFWHILEKIDPSQHHIALQQHLHRLVGGGGQRYGGNKRIYRFHSRLPHCLSVLVDWCLDFDPISRPTAKQFKSSLLNELVELEIRQKRRSDNRIPPHLA